MNVAVIYGQRHSGNTYKLTRMLIDRLNCPTENVHEFYVNGIEQCVGCMQCIMNDEKLCPHRQQTEPIISAIEAADVIIIASPTYCFEMTGQLKSFCDHLAYRWAVHRPADMRGKIGVAVSTAAGAGSGIVTKSIKRQLFWWTAGRIYRLYFNVRAEELDNIPAKQKKKLEHKIDALANKINRKAAHSKPCLKTRVLFSAMKKMHSIANFSSADDSYWKNADF